MKGKSVGERTSGLILTNIMKRERRVEERGRDNVSGTDNKQRKLQAGGYNGLLSGKNER